MLNIVFSVKHLVQNESQHHWCTYALTSLHVDLFQSCRDYLSRQGTNAETVWKKLVRRVHPVNIVFVTTSASVLVSSVISCLCSVRPAVSPGCLVTELN